MDGWFIGTGNQVEPGLGGTVRIEVGGALSESAITAWDPPGLFAHRSAAAPDGSLHAFEYTVTGHDRGTTVVRLVHSGFLADDWESEYDALNEGDYMYLHQLAQYVTWFRGRTAKVVVALRPDTERDRGMAILYAALGVSGEVAADDRVRFAPEGIPLIEGVVDFVSPSILGIRTNDALYRFTFPMGVVYLGHHIYRDDVDVPGSAAAWQAWLDRSFA